MVFTLHPDFNELIDTDMWLHYTVDHFNIKILSYQQFQYKDMILHLSLGWESYDTN